MNPSQTNTTRTLRKIPAHAARVVVIGCGCIALGALWVLYATDRYHVVAQRIGFGALVVVTLLMLVRKWRLSLTGNDTDRITATFGLYGMYTALLSVLSYRVGG